VKIAFNTANLVARVSGYRFELKDWGAQHRRTVEETDEAAWRTICRDIADAGFRAVEIWEAHAAPEVMTAERAATWKALLDEHGLVPVGYAGHLGEDTARVCRWLGIDAINGSAGGLSVAQMEAVCASSGVRFHFENHPEKSVEEIAAKIRGGSERLGVCVDTGWLGTQGVDAPAALRALGPLVRHVHVKDVRARGGHATCPLGEGVVDIAGCLAALRGIGYAGWYSWEDEPEDRNPLDIAAQSREFLERHLDA
jgi:sugar phosphate isomerase/epimerase